MAGRGSLLRVFAAASAGRQHPFSCRVAAAKKQHLRSEGRVKNHKRESAREARKSGDPETAGGIEGREGVMIFIDGV